MKTLTFRFICLRLLLIILSVPASALDLNYTAVINLQEISLGYAKDRFLVKAQVHFNPPEGFLQGQHKVGDDELGPQHSAAYLFLSGVNLVKVQTQVFRLAENGDVQEKLIENSEHFDSIKLLPAKNQDSIKLPIGDLYVSLSAAEITLPQNNEKLLLSLSGYVGVDVSYQKIGSGYQFLGYATNDNTQAMKLSETLVYRDPSYHSKSFSVQEQVPQGAPADLIRCSTAGESLPLRDLVMAGIFIHRVEYCYPIGTSFQRMVLPIHKPKTPDPETIAHIQDWIIRGTENIEQPAPLLQIPDYLLPEYNCHGYALKALLGSALDLPIGATWIEGKASPINQGTKAFPIILNNHFKLITSAQNLNSQMSSDAELAPAISAFLKNARPGDLISFFDGEDYVHTGILVKVPGQNDLWVQGKFEQGPVLTTPLANIRRVYVYDEARIFRRK